MTRSLTTIGIHSGTIRPGSALSLRSSNYACLRVVQERTRTGASEALGMSCLRSIFRRCRERNKDVDDSVTRLRK
jgi:hypothetical protein